MRGRPRDILSVIEVIGNRLPSPATLFMCAALVVMVLSQLGAWLGWVVTKTVTGSDGQGREVEVQAVGLLDSDGLWWVLSHMVDNFMSFPPLGLVLVAMLGIGIAERSGLIGALLQSTAGKTPASLLTPVVFFLGVMSSMALDAGYVVLPPLAAALYLATGRSPLVGLATAFAGVSAGFSANLFVTGLDPLLAGFSQAGANLVDESYAVSATANWYFMIASTFMLTAVGWLVTSKVVEPRLSTKAALENVSIDNLEHPEFGESARGLKWAMGAIAVSTVLILAMVLIPDAPLYGQGKRFDRWIEGIVPLILFFFIVPGIAYGYGARTIKNEKDISKLMGETMASLGPYIVLAFFAAQFIAFFKHSNLGEMLAVVGGQFLAQADFSSGVLVSAFIVVVMLGNLFIGSASAKYAFFAPVFVPMFMQVGISPELTQAAYRVGDSVTNVITPLNPYMVIVLAFLQRYAPKAGIGTLVAMMLPYAIAFAIAWLVLLMVWMVLGIPLGPGGPLAYVP